jgi:hypothetical protein
MSRFLTKLTRGATIADQLRPVLLDTRADAAFVRSFGASTPSEQVRGAISRFTFLAWWTLNIVSDAKHRDFAMRVSEALISLVPQLSGSGRIVRLADYIISSDEQLQIEHYLLLHDFQPAPDPAERRIPFDNLVQIAMSVRNQLFCDLQESSLRHTDESGSATFFMTAATFIRQQITGAHPLISASPLDPVHRAACLAEHAERIDPIVRQLQ